MECFKCNHINEPHAKFCSNCGKSFGNKNVNKSHQNNQTKIAYPNSEAVSMHEARQKEKAFNSILVIVIFAIIFGVVALLAGDIIGILFGAAITSIFFLFFFFAKKTVTEKYYYTIPTSKDNEGNHHCIYCGNKGIYKNTIYKTNTVVNSCSKCKKQLFRN